MIENIRGIAIIAGESFKGAYEDCCQDMLQSGFEWLENNKNRVPLIGHSYAGVYGVMIPDSDDCRALSKAVVAGAKGDCTGAMHQAVMSHLFYISANGLEKWKLEVKKRK